MTAEDFLEIGHLLQRSRSTEDGERVRRIVDEQIPIAEKIRRIREIDRLPDAAALPGTDNRDRLIKRRHVTTREAAAEHARHIKAEIRPASLMRYLVREYPEIRRFARRTGALNVRLLPPRIRIKHGFKHALLSGLHKEASRLLPLIDMVLDEGWVILARVEYNLVAAFRRLCDSLAFSNALIGCDDRMLFDRLQEIERRYLVCNCRAEYTEVIASSLGEVLRFFKKPADEIESVVLTARRILSPYWENLSLHNLILAVNIARSRRALQFRDLLADHPNGVVETFDFDCSEQVRSRIKSHILEGARELRELLDSRREADRVHFLLKEFVPSRGNGPERFDLTLLAEFHESGSGDECYSFATDQHHVPLFAHNFLKLFMSACAPLFGGKFMLQGGGECQVFAPDFFHGEFSQLALLEQNLSRVSFLRNGFTCEDYRRLHGAARSHATPSEIQIIQVLEEMGRVYAELGLKLGHVALSGTAPVDPDVPAIDLSMCNRPAFPVAGWEERLATPAFLKGRTLREALSRLAGLCLLLSLYLGNQRLEEAFQHGYEANERIAKLREVLERICDVVTFNTLRRELGL